MILLYTLKRKKTTAILLVTIEFVPFLNVNNEDLWISTIKGIDLYSKKNNSWQHYNYPIGTNKEAHINNAPTLFKDYQNRIWLGYEKGLAYFDKESNTFVDYTINNKKSNFQCSQIYF